MRSAPEEGVNNAETTSELSNKIKAIREKLLTNANGDTPSYSAKVEIDAGTGPEAEALMASHSVYSRSGY